MKVSIRELEIERERGFRLLVPDLSIEASCATALFGPNGAGKTTLLRAIAGLESGPRGSVLLDGRPAAEVAPRQVAYAFQEAVFFSGSVRRNLALALDLRGVDSAEAARRIADVAQATGTTALLDADARRLSGGEAKRVNLARALALRSPLTLLDEPFAQLDGPLRLRLLDDLPDLLERFTQTALIVTHDLEEAARLASRLVVVIDGEVRAHDEVATLLRQPPDPEVARLLGFVLVEGGGGALAIQPGRLRVGDGPVRVDMTVRRVIDLGHAIEVVGAIGDARVAVVLPRGHQRPAPGETFSVAADEAVRFSK